MSMWVGCCNFCNTHFFIQFTAFKNLCQVAATVRLNKTKVQLSVGETVKLKVKGTKKKATWSVANKEVLSVTKKGKVTAKKKGTSMVYAKVGKKKLSCKVTVKKQTVTQAPQEAPTIIPIPWDLPI